MLLLDYENDKLHNLEIFISQEKGEKPKIEEKYVVEGAMEEAIQKLDMAIDTFRHFRYLINQILPFKQEVMISLLKEVGPLHQNFDSLISNFNLEENPQKIKVNM